MNKYVLLTILLLVSKVVMSVDIHEAARWNELNVVKELIKAKADVNARDRDGKTPLYEAATWGYIDVVQELITAGAEVNVRDGRQWTPLHIALMWGNFRVAQELIKAKADIHALSINKRPPLYYAVCYSYGNVRDLLEAGADVNVRDEGGKTPLYYAEHYVKCAYVTQLLKYWPYYQRGIAKLGCTSAQAKDHTIEQIHEIAEQERARTS